MKRSRAFPVLLLISLVGSCGTTKQGGLPHPVTDAGQLQTQYTDLLAKLPADRAGVQPQMAALATQAQTVAQGEVNPQTKVALYKTAALAAWQAGPALGASLQDIVAQGEAACNALPAGQQRPTDCTMMRLALPFGIADAFQLRLRALLDKLAQLESAHAQTCNALSGPAKQTCVTEAVKLPASDRSALLQVFAGFENAFTQARDVSRGMTDVGPGLQDATKRGLAIIYCDTEKTWGLSKRVDGLQPQDRSALTCRRKRLDCLLTRSDADCADPCPSDEGNPVVPCDQLAGKPFTLPASPGATPP
jgi:hypothetical protein